MPGVETILTDQPPSPSSPSDTGRVFAIQQSERGPVDKPILVRSLQEFTAKAGKRVPYSVMWDAVDGFFREGGGILYYGRVVGPAAAPASLILKNNSGANTLEIYACEPGEWGNGLTCQTIVTEGTYVFVISLNGVEVERSPSLTDELDAVEWALNKSTHVRAKDLTAGSGNPVTHAAQALTGGMDDRAKITTANYETALALNDPELGCGQVAAPGISSEGVQKALLAHCEVSGRTPLLDDLDSTEASYHLEVANALRSSTGSRRGAPFIPWGILPPLAPGLPERTVPYSMIQAGIIARNDAKANPPLVNEPSAADPGPNGIGGISRSLIGLTASWDKATREELNGAGINVALIDTDAQIKTYGYRTLANQEAEPAWVMLSASRLFMYVAAEGKAVLKQFVLKQNDPDKALIGRVGAELQGFLEKLAKSGQLYNDPATAVDVGPSVNTPEVIAAKQLRARIAVKPSPIVETEYLEIGVEAV
jgi:phage tail sheath protein FI